MRRLGIFGGSFDPVHLGHLLVAQAAHEECDLERVFFVPAAQSPFKTAAPLAPAEQRLRLLRLALAGYPQFAVDDQEIRRGKVSYTIETVRDYKARYPDAELYYLIGADHVAQLPKWREAEALAQLLQFVVIPRPGEPAETLPAPFRGRALKGFPFAVSSTEIRQRIRAGLPVELLVGPLVAEAIRRERLYVND